MTPVRRALPIILPLALAGLGAAPYVPWEDLTESDWLYSLATRFADRRRPSRPLPDADGRAGGRRSKPAPTPRRCATSRRRGASWATCRARCVLLREVGRGRGARGLGRSGALGRRARARCPSPSAPRPAACPASADDAKRVAGRRAGGAGPTRIPRLADPLALRQERARAVPRRRRRRSKTGCGRSRRRAGSTRPMRPWPQGPGLTPERRLLLRSDLLADHGDTRRAFEVLDGALDGPEAWSQRRCARPTPSARTRAARRARVVALRSRAALSTPRAAAPRHLLPGPGPRRRRRRPAAAGRAPLRVGPRSRGLAPGRTAPRRDRRRARGLPRAARRGAAGGGATTGRTTSPRLARLALRAGGRPLAWGTYNDEPYRWVARLDRTPGFWTGGVSFLLTGQDWKEALARLESESLPERTFATARALVGELVRRAPAHAELPSAARRGHGPPRRARRRPRGAGPAPPGGGRPARGGGRGAADRAPRRCARSRCPLAEELRLYRARLAHPGPGRHRGPSWSREPASGAAAATTRSGKAWTRQAPRRPASVTQTSSTRRSRGSTATTPRTAPPST